MAVLSFFGKVLLKAILLLNILQKEIVNTMSLQVLCSPLLNTSRTSHSGKRALPFTSYRDSALGLQASMTLEAAMVLPIFLFSAIALLAPMRAMDTQRKLQTEMECSCEEMSLYLYGQENTETGLLKQMDEQGNIEQKMIHVEKIPFFSRIAPEISIEIGSRRRGWIGIPGKLTVSSEKIYGLEDENAEEMVYVGKNMGRFHRNRKCHYISNEYQTISRKSAEKMRDSDGRLYTACSSCGKNGEQTEIVYVTSGGRHYHNRMDCQAMASYVRKVPISEVSHLGACSYCGGE